MGDLTKNFSREEFECPDCGQYEMDEDFIDALQRAREKFGDAIHITSGYRCAKRNKAIGGAEMSLHLTGQAADIYVTDNTMRYRLVEALYASGITRIYVYAGHVHADCKPVIHKILGHG